MGLTPGVEPPEGEAEVVWLRDLSELDYVRASLTTSRSRTAPIEYGTGRSDYYETVGYSTLTEDAPTTEPNAASMFTRRVFWLKAVDRGGSEYDGESWTHNAPAEAVDPRTVSVGVRGRLTDRARGR